MTGIFVAFEGGEGSGKSTQAARLAARLGDTVVVTRQPGGTPLGQIIRDLVLDPERGISDRAEALLYAADRAQHTDEIIRPALAAGQTIITDRYIDSSIAYQAYGRGMNVAWITELSRWATGGLVPDLTVLLDIDPKAGLTRAAGRSAADRLEQAGHAFHARVRCGYLELATANPDRYLVLDATRPADELADMIAGRVRMLLGQEVAA